jgi:hypothetical protein
MINFKKGVADLQALLLNVLKLHRYEDIQINDNCLIVKNASTIDIVKILNKLGFTEDNGILHKGKYGAIKVKEEGNTASSHTAIYVQKGLKERFDISRDMHDVMSKLRKEIDSIIMINFDVHHFKPGYLDTAIDIITSLGYKPIGAVKGCRFYSNGEVYITLDIASKDKMSAYNDTAIVILFGSMPRMYRLSK